MTDSRLSSTRSEKVRFFVIVEGDGEVGGRVNISDIDRPGLTELGFRVAEHAQGRGLATEGVLTALDVAAQRGVRTVKARISTENLPSRRLLERCGFAPTGREEAPDGAAGTFDGYRKDLDGPM
jgi:ribosomal-protein-alanine N-acetyltransferase